MNEKTQISAIPVSSGEFSQDFIPDLCRLDAVMISLVLTQLFAVIVGLTSSQNILMDWEFLGLFSMFCHAIVLSSSAVICQSRRLFSGKSLVFVSGYCLGALLLVTGAYSALFLNLRPPGLETPNWIFLGKGAIISVILGGLMLRYFYLQHQWRMQKQAELNSRLQALQARIRPHFLFNSMNSIASLISIDPERAEDAVLDLSELFRATLKNQSLLTPLDEELALCRRYLNIESLRLGPRLQVDWQIEEAVGRIQIPPLTLQPLLENAIYHGIQPRTEGGTITVKAYLNKNSAYILISNPEPHEPSKHKGNNMALENIRSRLKSLFGHEAIIKTSHLDQRYTVTVRVPREAKYA